MSSDRAESRFDHVEPGWFVPRVKSTEQAEEIKSGLVRGYGPATGLATLRWLHDGVVYTARVGEGLVFHSVDEGVVVAILGTPQLYKIVTLHRGLITDGPILVGPGALSGTAGRPDGPLARKPRRR